MYLLATRVTSAEVTLLDAVLVLLEEVRRIAVKGQEYLLVQRLLGRVVVEDEGVHARRPWPAHFGGRGWLGLQAADLFEHRLGCGDGGHALGADVAAEDAGVVVCGAEAAADVVGQAEFGAHVLNDAGAEAAREYLVHHAEGVVVGIAAFGAQADDVHGGLIDVFLVDESRRRAWGRESRL